MIIVTARLSPHSHLHACRRRRLPFPLILAARGHRRWICEADFQSAVVSDSYVPVPSLHFTSLCFFESRVCWIVGVYCAKRGRPDPDSMQVLSFYGNRGIYLFYFFNAFDWVFSVCFRLTAASKRSGTRPRFCKYIINRAFNIMLLLLLFFPHTLEKQLS